MPKIEIRNATLFEIIEVLDHLRDADRTELWAASRTTPSQAAIPCYAVGAKVGLIDDVPAVIFGCGDYEGTGVPWLLGTDDVLRIPVRFVKLSKKIVDEWVQERGVLSNYIHAKNTVSLKWLKWLGFEIVGSILNRGEVFYRFERRL